MNRIRLLAPDLFPLQEIATEVCAGLRLPALEKLLGRGKATSSRVTCLEDWLCAAFGGQSVAPVRAASPGLVCAAGSGTATNDFPAAAGGLVRREALSAEGCGCFALAAYLHRSADAVVRTSAESGTR